ncbi:hypothetical protein EUX98_g8565 [Antrodiella citrinella]|uniref:Protein kinase domain-containing protein n=1 Tax=Antrodiella citrinella TaxID=2447956 RepID=A0A4S4M7W0_9APHY|nr:hypothetical protein EUX98_g8565 [Antrodiella citrinella]
MSISHPPSASNPNQYVDGVYDSLGALLDEFGTDTPDTCEDGVMSLQDKVLDATHMSEGYIVSIKAVPTSNEINIAQLLSSEELRSRPDNHCIPVLDVLDVLPDLLDDSNTLLVMPYLRPFDDPPFEIVEEIMDFIHQTLEGLCFIHEQEVAHR